MINIHRRNFLKLSGSAVFAGLIPSSACSMKDFQDKDSGQKISPVIHAADLYHVHCDPDDHWDLACIYALAYSNLIDLQGILIDYPIRENLGEPDVLGVAQMNYYTGKVVPAVVGSPFLMKDRNDIQNYSGRKDHQSIKWVSDILMKAKEPVIINIVGTATNIALALKKEPTLFKEKCKCIYLNAGSGYHGKNNEQEYNVTLDPSAYAAIFDAECPVYWMPCVQVAGVGEVGQFGTYYCFRQGDILPHLPDTLQNFFLFMLDRKKSHQWLTYLKSKPEGELLVKYSQNNRGMWCTAGFLHAAGKKVTVEGKIVEANSPEKAIFNFLPVDVSCDDKGFTTWRLIDNSKNRFIFEVADPENYQKAMTAALKELLLKLPV